MMQEPGLGVTERALTAALRSVFSPAILLNVHPRTLIQVVFQALSPPQNQTNGRSTVVDSNLSLTAALINAGSLAFLQASSIPLIGIVVAVSLGVKRVGKNRILIVDPEDEEIPDLVGGGVFAFVFSQSHTMNQDQHEKMMHGRLVWSSWDGIFDVAEVAKAEALARQKCLEIVLLFRQILSGEELVDSKMIVD
jgi:exosome complex component RRP46